MLFSAIAFRRIGSPFTISDFLANGPSSLPSKIRGGDTLPSAIPIAAEQCASICATFILPHRRSLSGLRCAIRSVISFTAADSKRFFIRINLEFSRLRKKMPIFSSTRTGWEEGISSLRRMKCRVVSETSNYRSMFSAMDVHDAILIGKKG
jgi:hypothetical protein